MHRPSTLGGNWVGVTRFMGALPNVGERAYGGSMTLVGWFDAANGGQATEGKCRCGYMVGLMLSTLKGPCHIWQWTSQFARKMAKSSLGGEVYARSEMVCRILLLKDFYGPFDGTKSGVVGLEDCQSLRAHLKTRKMFTEKCLVRHFSSCQQSLEEVGLETAYWLPGTEYPADGLTQVRGDMVPLLRLFESGRYFRGGYVPSRVWFGGSE